MSPAKNTGHVPPELLSFMAKLACQTIYNSVLLIVTQVYLSFFNEDSSIFVSSP
jgi:hypothetical protein